MNWWNRDGGQSSNKRESAEWLLKEPMRIGLNTIISAMIFFQQARCRIGIQVWKLHKIFLIIHPLIKPSHPLIIHPWGLRSCRRYLGHLAERWERLRESRNIIPHVIPPIRRRDNNTSQLWKCEVIHGLHLSISQTYLFHKFANPSGAKI